MSFHNRKLPNYLRTYRRRAGFSQDDVAYLLGCHSGAKVCRYERFTRQPSLRTALAYEVIFHVPIRELLAGQYEEVEREVRRRAGVLARRLANAPQGRMTVRKVESLKTIYPPPLPTGTQSA